MILVYFSDHQFVLTAVVIFIGQGNYCVNQNPTTSINSGLGTRVYFNDQFVLTAVVMFIGQGNLYNVSQNPRNLGLGGGFQQIQPHNSSTGFGDIMFVDDNGLSWNYQPVLEDLKARNTLFISLADYTERAFERMFKGEIIANFMLVSQCTNNFRCS